MDYPELRTALTKFRELFQRNILLPSVVNGKEIFLKRMRMQSNWSSSDALRVYNIIKPHELKLAKIGFKFNSVPLVRITTVQPTKRVMKLKTPSRKLIGYDKDSFVVSFPYNTNLIAAIRMIPDAKWNNDKRYWNVPLARINQLREFGHRFKFEYTKKGLEMIKNIKDNFTASYKAEKVELDLPMKLEPYPFQYAGIDYGMKNKKVIIADEMGCIVGNAVINANLGGNSFKMRLDDLYIKFKHSTVKHKFKARSLKDNIFGLNKIDNIIYKGVKETYDIETKSGKSLGLTLDHEILTPDGYVELEKLKEGDSIIINGKLVCKDCGSDEDIIISINYAGKKPVYDIVMADPYRNFVANGIVVHNCGKTPQAIGVALGLDAFPALIICPKSLRLNWQNEWHKFSNKKAFILTHKNIKNLERYFELGMYDVAIMNFEGARTLFTKEIHEIEITKGKRAGKTNKKIILHGYEKLFKTAILDESHNCRNDKTIRFKTIKPVMAAAEIRLALTGSPIVKGTSDLASLLELIGRIDDFGGRWKFIRRFNKFKRESFHAKALPANLRELNIKLRSLCFIRREKHQVLKELPDKIIQIVKVNLDNKVEYNDAFNAFRFWMQSQDYDQEKIDRAMRAEMLVKIGVLKRLSARGKLSAFSEFVDEVICSGEKLVVFCWHKETANYLKDNFDNVLLITGDVSDEEVEENKHKFMTDPKYKMIVCTFMRGGEGHTLTAASKIAIIEPGWTHKDHSQAIDRIHRIGQENTVNAYCFVGEDTIDEDIYDIIEQRRLMEKEATGGQTEINISIRIAKRALQNETSKVEN